MVRAIRVVAAAGLAAAAMAGCGNGDDDRAEAPPPTTTTTAAPVAPTSETVSPAECRPADRADVVSINLSMTHANTHVEQAFTAGDGSFRYVAANLYETDGTRLPPPALWVFDDGALYTLSDNARASSMGTLDGRTLGLSPQDAIPLALQGCVVDATR